MIDPIKAARMKAAGERYARCLHMVQTGIAQTTVLNMKELGRDQGLEPKHLRVGIDARAADQKGLVELLIKKGVFDELEYHEAVADSMQAEAEMFARELSERMGVKVTLG